jgi:hypothetical protein
LLQYINGIEQPLEIAFLYKRRSEVRHDEVSHEHHTRIAQVNKHGIVRFSTLHRDQRKMRAADGQLRTAVDGNVRLESANVVGVEAFAEKAFRENLRGVEFSTREKLDGVAFCYNALMIERALTAEEERRLKTLSEATPNT